MPLALFGNADKDRTKMKITSKITLFAAIGLLALETFALAADHPATSVGADAALAKLKEGNARFVSNKVSEGKPNAAKRAETAQSQHPFAIIVGCSDSRTSPEIIFDQNIGDLFVVRIAGNVVDDDGLGSIEYAVEHLGARLVVVLGHSRCGAVIAAMAGDTARGHVESLVRALQPAVKAAKGKSGDATNLTITENAALMAAKVRDDAALGDLAKDVRIVSAVYDLETGKVDWAKE
jgi:carbonic anhydrase